MPRLTPVDAPISLELDGVEVPAREGEPVAAALIAHGELLFARSPKYHRPRGPYCLTGGCSQCLMRVDGVPNTPTCRVPARRGMKLERQNAVPDAEVDVLRAADFVFRRWFNHHEFLAGVPIAEAVLQKVARQLSGLGTLPDRPAPPRPPARHEALGTVILGGGAAGLGAARRLTERGHTYTLLEREAVLGGRLVSAAEADQPAPWAPPPGQVRCGALAVGLFADDGPPFLVVVEQGALVLCSFERLILTVGGHPAFPTFPNNDLPGVMAARAVSTLIRRHGVLPGRRIACLGEPQQAAALAVLVRAAGGEPVLVGGTPVQAHGLSRVTAVSAQLDMQERKERCEVVALCGPPSPAFELARAAGAGVRWAPEHHLFVVEADEAGRTAVPWLFVAGELRGPVSALAATQQGARTADALAEGRP